MTAERWLLLIVSVGGRRLRLRLLDAVDQDAVDELVVEADQPLDAQRLVDRIGIVPDQVLVALPVQRQVIEARDALVGAARDVAAGAEQLEARVRDGQIVPRRMAGLEEEDPLLRIRHLLAADEDLDPAGGREAVDPPEGIAGMDED